MSKFEEVKNSIQIPQKDLLDEQTEIAELKKYNILLQNIEIPKDLDAYLKRQMQKKIFDNFINCVIITHRKQPDNRV